MSGRRGEEQDITVTRSVRVHHVLMSGPNKPHPHLNEVLHSAVGVALNNRLDHYGRSHLMGNKQTNKQTNKTVQ